jgi:hypothetical protein
MAKLSPDKIKKKILNGTFKITEDLSYGFKLYEKPLDVKTIPNELLDEICLLISGRAKSRLVEQRGAFSVPNLNKKSKLVFRENDYLNIHEMLKYENLDDKRDIASQIFFPIKSKFVRDLTKNNSKSKIFFNKFRSLNIRQLYRMIYRYQPCYWEQDIILYFFFKWTSLSRLKRRLAFYKDLVDKKKIKQQKSLNMRKQYKTNSIKFRGFFTPLRLVNHPTIHNYATNKLYKVGKSTKNFNKSNINYSFKLST